MTPPPTRAVAYTPGDQARGLINDDAHGTILTDVVITTTRPLRGGATRVSYRPVGASADTSDYSTVLTASGHSDYLLPALPTAPAPAPTTRRSR